MDVPSPSPIPTPPPSTTTVHISHGQFAAAGLRRPGGIHIRVGDTLLFANDDLTEHTATSDPGVVPSWDTGEIAPGSSASVSFPIAGAFPFHCAIHPHMRGVVMVTEA